jgi:uncharacterized membrane protein YphA (DoxX/SURF4 family)
MITMTAPPDNLVIKFPITGALNPINPPIKIPIQQGTIDWLASKGLPFADLTWRAVAWGEMLAGIGILIGGLIGLSAPVIGNLITRLSGGAVMVIMIGALLLAHSDWGIFFGERGSILFASEQLFLLLLGTYFAIKGNDQ